MFPYETFLFGCFDLTQGREIIDRMRQAAEAKTDLALAAFLEVPRGTIASWRRRNAVPLEHVMAFAVKARVSLDWLLTGHGEAAPQQRGVTIAGLDYRLLAIAIDQAERTVRKFPKASKTRPAQWADLILQLYVTVKKLRDEWKKTTQLDDDALIKAIRRAYSLDEDSDQVWFWRSGKPLIGEVNPVRELLERGVSVAEITPEMFDAIIEEKVES